MTGAEFLQVEPDPLRIWVIRKETDLASLSPSFNIQVQGEQDVINKTNGAVLLKANTLLYNLSLIHI